MVYRLRLENVIGVKVYKNLLKNNKSFKFNPKIGDQIRELDHSVPSLSLWGTIRCGCSRHNQQARQAYIGCL